MDDLAWTKRMLGAFIEQTCLSEEEQAVLTDWASKRSIVHTAMSRNISTRTVDRIRKRLRMLYDAVQPYTPELPPRSTRS
jgi:hypothetical protein